MSSSIVSVFILLLDDNNEHSSAPPSICRLSDSQQAPRPTSPIMICHYPIATAEVTIQRSFPSKPVSHRNHVYILHPCRLITSLSLVMHQMPLRDCTLHLPDHYYDRCYRLDWSSSKSHHWKMMRNVIG